MKKCPPGQSMVEMALIVPILILFIAGIIDGGYYVYTYSELENAARRGSEWAYKSPPTTVVSTDDSSDKCAQLIKKAVMEHVFLSDLTPSNITISYPDPSMQERDVGAPIQVQVDYTGHWLTPLGRRIFGPNISFSFASRRTIVNITAPADMTEDCS